jgi:hypothetical protein
MSFNQMKRQEAQSRMAAARKARRNPATAVALHSIRTTVLQQTWPGGRVPFNTPPRSQITATRSRFKR